MADRHDLALARARVLLAQIAPEIPEEDIVPQAHLVDDLGLDAVSIWALAAGLEKMAKVEINDADITASTTVASLLEHALSDVPVEFLESTGGEVDTPAEAEGTNGHATDAGTAQGEASAAQGEPGAEGPEDLQSALEDLADLFKS